MKKWIAIVGFLIFFSNAYTQATLSWSRDFEVGIDAYYAEAPTIETDNQTIKVIGRKNTLNGQRLEIVSYSLIGEIISATSFGDAISNSKVIDYKLDTNNQLYLLLAETLSYHKTKIVFQKYSLDGTLIWSAQIQDAAAISYRPFSIGLTSGNCIFINAFKEIDYPQSPTDADGTISIPYLYAYDFNGSLLWQRELNTGSDNLYFQAKLLIYNNMAFIFTNDYKLLKVDSNNTLTQIDMVGVYDGINNVQVTNDNNLLFTAFTKFKFTRTNSNGASFFLREYPTFLTNNVVGDQIESVTEDSDGNIYLTGRHYGHNYGTPSYTNGDILTLKYSPNGTLLWENRYQYGINNGDFGNCITLKNGYLYVGGESQRQGQFTDNDYITLKINAATGQTSQVYRYNGLESGNDSVSSICVLDNGNYAITGLSFSNSKYNWTTQFFTDSNLSIESNTNRNAITIAPNPISIGNFLTITGLRYSRYKMLSSMGQIVQSGTLNLESNQKILMEKVKPGVYMLQLENETEKTVKKVIIN